MASVNQTVQLDLANQSVREVNQFLHQDFDDGNAHYIEILHPDGNHSIGVGLDADADIDIRGHAGYYVAGMNRQARVTIHGNVGWSVAENIMSGSVRVKGNASQCAAASGHGGLVVIEGDASSRCGISMKGVDIVVGGSVGHLSGFMAQAGRMVICGDADAGLGDSIYEAVIYVAGKIHGLGADARKEPMSAEDVAAVTELLEQAQLQHDPQKFKRIASARTLYHWNADVEQEY
ncbi:MAG: hypothetical protein ABGX16_25205 [Pirellulales bacterium]